MSERIVTPPPPGDYPTWMKDCNLAFFGPSSASPISLAYCPPGGQTSELRFQWFPKDEGDTGYSPSGQLVSEWMSDDPTLTFVGKYAHKKVIKSVGTAPIKAQVWLRFWDENGFAWDSPTLRVAG
jgi:hypothetical protein